MALLMFSIPTLLVPNFHARGVPKELSLGQLTDLKELNLLFGLIANLR